MKTRPRYPQRIICMTEESVETLYALGLQERIIGVSAYVKRPKEAQKKPVISSFLKANISKILELKPDLVLGFSDIQKDIARDLIGEGVEVWIANHRSIDGILSYIARLGGMLGEENQAKRYVEELKEVIERTQNEASRLSFRPKVYFEEWDDPMIAGIQWVSEAIALAGGEDIFADLAQNSLAKERFVSGVQVAQKNPDLIFGCWCGKKVSIPSICSRKNFSAVPAVLKGQVHELNPAIFLQPGPAVISDGLKLLLNYFRQLN